MGNKAYDKSTIQLTRFYFYLCFVRIIAECVWSFAKICSRILNTSVENCVVSVKFVWSPFDFVRFTTSINMCPNSCRIGFSDHGTDKSHIRFHEFSDIWWWFRYNLCRTCGKTYVFFILYNWSKVNWMHFINATLLNEFSNCQSISAKEIDDIDIGI